jgi:tripartite-type tricarboxylate transporter receptor subunit TctC
MNSLLRLLAATAMLAVTAPAAVAQTYPGKPIRLIVPFAPGGFTDVVARLVGQKLSAALGQSVVVENRPGAGSTLGSDVVAKAAPDGYTLLMVSSTHVIGPWLYKNVPYDPIKSFAPISKLGESPYVLMVNSKVPARDVKELIALAKAQPNQIHYASSGNGSSQHLIGGLFVSLTGAPLMHVPYKGSGMAAQDLQAGVVESTFAGVPNALSVLQSGRARALAVTSARRIPQLPDVPTLQEAGVAGYDASVWLALLAPAGTPAAIVNRLNGEVAKLMATPETRKALYDVGVEVSLSTPQELGEYLRVERDRWGKVVKEAGIQID